MTLKGVSIIQKKGAEVPILHVRVGGQTRDYEGSAGLFQGYPLQWVNVADNTVPGLRVSLELDNMLDLYRKGKEKEDEKNQCFLCGALIDSEDEVECGKEKHPMKRSNIVSDSIMEDVKQFFGISDDSPSFVAFAMKLQDRIEQFGMETSEEVREIILSAVKSVNIGE